MQEPAYVSIAGEYAHKIRSGELPPGIQLPSYAEIAQRSNVSNIVVRKAIELLQSQGLVRSVRRRGIFVTDRPSLVRVTPERQTEDPETTFRNETGRKVHLNRDSQNIAASDELAEIFGLLPGDSLTHVVTRVTEDQRPISISDTYQLPSIVDSTDARFLEETISDRLPTPEHAAWLKTAPGDLVRQAHQRFFTSEGQLIMLSDVSYPRDHYDAFMYRIDLHSDFATTGRKEKLSE